MYSPQPPLHHLCRRATAHSRFLKQTRYEIVYSFISVYILCVFPLCRRRQRWQRWFCVRSACRVCELLLFFSFFLLFFIYRTKEHCVCMWMPPVHIHSTRIQRERVVAKTQHTRTHPPLGSMGKKSASHPSCACVCCVVVFVCCVQCVRCVYCVLVLHQIIKNHRIFIKACAITARCVVCYSMI